MARVLADTNVLFPFSLMDLMLWLSQDQVHTLLWSDRLLGEWEQVIVREQRRSPQSAASITKAIRETFPEDRIPEDSYRHLVSQLSGPDPDDLHHIAAAAVGGASTLVTWNLADFPAATTGPLGIIVTDPETYLCGLLERDPAEVEATLRRMASVKRRPPMSPIDITDALAHAGVPVFAERARIQIAKPPGPF
jgi:predicted nucleic acid-binding protein